jgi:hypothetical protein
MARRGLVPDLEASHPKLGFLIREAAEHAVKAKQPGAECERTESFTRHDRNRDTTAAGL